MRNGFIYIMCDVNDFSKKYVGQSITPLYVKISNHKQKVKKRNSRLYTHLKTLDFDQDIVFTILEDSIPYDELSRAEYEYIVLYNSVENGLNSTYKTNQTTNANHRENDVMRMFKEGYGTGEMASKLGLSSATISRILQMNGEKQYNKVDNKELIKLWPDCLNLEIAEYFGVNEKTIRRRAKKLNLPQKPKRPDYSKLKRLDRTK